MEIILVVGGTRDFDDYEFFCRKLDTYIAFFGYTVIKVISGDAAGPDQMTEDWAISRGYDFEAMPAKWKREDGTTDREAGFKRNIMMISRGTHCVFFHDGKSPGTAHAIDQCKPLGKSKVVIPIETTPKRYYCERWRKIYRERKRLREAA